jgi:hypothetical protein
VKDLGERGLSPNKEANTVSYYNVILKQHWMFSYNTNKEEDPILCSRCEHC